MSRIGRRPIEIPEKVKVTINNGDIKVEGPKGTLSEKIPYGIDVKIEDGKIIVTRSSDSKQMKSLHGLTRALIANMVTGVTQGFQKVLRIAGMGYKAQFENGKLTLQLNASHPIIYEVPKGIDVAIDRPETVQNQPEIPVTIMGIDKHLVGHVAAIIRDFQKPEPYRGKGIKYADEFIRRKAGKAAG
ncbi:TPA: 50S ribosomal protein L6 [Candidatus Poribacteria bacterium]|nr:50S ribosomal protein L6 [Candidatus Poribacteria bacterium]